MKFISLFLALLCFLASCSQSPDESPQLSQESIVGVWSCESVRRQHDNGLIKFFSDGTGEIKSVKKTVSFKWYIDTTRKLSEWYDDSASKPTSLTLELDDSIQFGMYEISESGTLTFGMDKELKNHILRHNDIVLGKRLATKEAPH